MTDSKPKYYQNAAYQLTKKVSDHTVPTEVKLSYGCSESGVEEFLTKRKSCHKLRHCQCCRITLRYCYTSQCTWCGSRVNVVLMHCPAHDSVCLLGSSLYSIFTLHLGKATSDILSRWV